MSDPGLQYILLRRVYKVPDIFVPLHSLTWSIRSYRVDFKNQVSLMLPGTTYSAALLVPPLSNQCLRYFITLYSSMTWCTIICHVFIGSCNLFCILCFKLGPGNLIHDTKMTWISTVWVRFFGKKTPRIRNYTINLMSVMSFQFGYTT